MKKYVFIFMVLTLLLTACGTSQTQQETTAPTGTDAVSSATATTSISTQATEESRPPVDRFVVNPNLTTWCESYSEYLGGLTSYEGDWCRVSDGIMFGETRTGIGGYELADGGAYSVEGTFTFGAGSGLENPDLWYVSFTFKNIADPVDIEAHTLCAVAACASIYESTAQRLTDGQSFQDVFYDIVEQLCRSQVNVAFEVGDMVFAAKLLSDGSRLILVDSLDFYNAFYAGSIANYYVLE